MNNQQAYNIWSQSYDKVLNKTRDLEAKALKKALGKLNFNSILEIGCGTGKNTKWLLSRSNHLVGIDFSTEMLNKAKEKINSPNVKFKEVDIRKKWDFNEGQFDLITCSLILEHIENLDFIFRQVNRALKKGSIFYIGELHPFKQYKGSKARFDTGKGMFELECFIHHISDYFTIAKNNNMECIGMQEFFDEDKRTGLPRILSLMFKK